METFEEFFLKNPDVPTKLKITATAFFAIAFVLTGASILTSLALTFVYLSLHCGILYVIRNKTITNSKDGSSEPDQFMDMDTDEEDLDDYDLIVPQEGIEEKILKPFPRRHFADSTPTSTNVIDHKFRNAFAVKLSPDEHYKIGKSMYNSKFLPTKKHMEFGMSGMEPSKSIGMNQSRHGSNNRLVGFPMSPEPQHVLGIERWKLSRQPLRPTVRNSPSGAGFGKYAPDKNFAMNISKPSFQTTSVKLNVPQTSSPFHEQSPVGLWDALSLSAIAGSPRAYISPIASPSKENDTLNRSSQYIFVDSPSPEKGLGLSDRHHPLHSTGHPVDSKRHILPVKSSSSHWQRLNQKEQTALPITGRPRLQSPVTVRIARPQNHSSSEKRHQRRPLINQDPGDSLRKDVILSALREKRKRGKAGQEEDRDEENSTSFQEDFYEGGARLKKRRLDNYEETRKSVLRPKPRRNTGNMFIPAETPSETDTRDEMEVADSSFEGRSGRSSFHRNAIVSSLSSSKIWKDNLRKRSLYSDEQEKLPKLPPKKVTRGTDVSDLEPKKSKEREETTEVNSSKKGDNSRDKEETAEGKEHEKTVLSPRLRKRAVFTALHRGKQTKPPSPEQITAADLYEDRQRALQRIQQMRMLLRDEEATHKESPKEADKPLLPVAKPPQTGVSPLASALPVAPVSSFTETDSRTKPLGQMKGTNASTKPLTFGTSLFDKSGKDSPGNVGLIDQTKKETPKSSSGSASVSFGLSRTAPTNTLSVAVSSPPASSKPSSLLQALSSMQKSVEADSKRGSSLPLGGSLGFIGQPSVQGNPSTSSTASSTVSSTSVLPPLVISTNSASLTTTTTAPTFNFGSGSTGLLKGSENTNVLSSSAAQPSFQFGSGSSKLTTSSTGQLTQPQTFTSSSSFGSSAPPPYGSNQSIAPKTVSSAPVPVSSAPVSVQSSFMFGSAPAVTQSGGLSSGLNFNSGSTSNTSTAQSSGVGTFSFGAAAQSQPTFSFGQSVTKSQETTPSVGFGFTSGQSTATTGQKTSSGPSSALFSFGAAPASTTTTAASSSLFQMNPQTTSITTSIGTTPSPFTFGAAKPPTTSSNTAKAPASFSFGQATPSAGFTFGSQQSNPASQGSLFPSNQSSSQPGGGFTFGAPSQKPASQGSVFSSGQTPQQTGFSFGGQSSQGTSQTQLFPSAQQSQSNSMFGSTSTPALNFGSQAASTPSSLFQFGAATPPQQQPTSGFNFSATPSTNFGFGGTSSVPAFGQGQQATPPRPGTGFSIGSTNAPRKTASARMRQRQRAGRR